MAIKPEENQSSKHCTLFQPVFVNSNNNRYLRLRHVNTGNYVRRHDGTGDNYDGCLTLLPKLQPEDKTDDICTFIDWESVVMLPNLVRIKGENGNHLKAYDGDGLMDFLSRADTSSVYDYQVCPSRDGGIRLKSTRHGTYWTKEASPAVHEISTVFLPTKLDGSHIALRCLKNGFFCKRYTVNDRKSCLPTITDSRDEFGCMEIEEPVISRKIDNVRYHLNDARIYNERSVALISDDSSNKTQHSQASQANLKTTVSDTTNWRTSISLNLGVKMTATLGIPLITSGSLEVSAEQTRSLDWGETETQSRGVGVSYEIPFSYTQRDVLMNGSAKVTEKSDGIFTGNNGYGYRFEVVQLPFE
ncbi:hypothetical protein MKW98_003667 [Papaver atlanticum]|uniref:Agglutinin domain-containing protein n=1 Tax=Papaver atlanticum TaxID=357466 RepID=A0AAD4SIG9_9MAGN|nr:hypothetical protein MKW98_003667 [Papaver atlanticum]